GEGEIVRYALQHSKHLIKSHAFAKCTGKLWVANHARCNKGFNGTAGFQMHGKRKVVYIDTRFYIVSKDFYKTTVQYAHMGVNDASGHYLEHAFAGAMSHLTSRQIALFPSPDLRGLSGTRGEHYQSTALSRIKANLRGFSYRLINRE